MGREDAKRGSLVKGRSPMFSENCIMSKGWKVDEPNFRAILKTKSSPFLVVRRGAPGSVLVPSSKARSP